jgi:hypothetical protein
MRKLSEKQMNVLEEKFKNEMPRLIIILDEDNKLRKSSTEPNAKNEFMPIFNQLNRWGSELSEFVYADIHSFLSRKYKKYGISKEHYTKHKEYLDFENLNDEQIDKILSDFSDYILKRDNDKNIFEILYIRQSEFDEFFKSDFQKLKDAEFEFDGLDEMIDLGF